MKPEILDRLATMEGSSASPVLTVYLNVDQSDSANLNRGFEVPLKNMLRQTAKTVDGEAQTEAFEADAEPVRRFVSEYVPSNNAKALLFFSDASAGLFEQQSFSVPAENAVHWKPWPHLRPLAEALALYEPCGVILVDREKARLWRLQLGAVTEKDVTEAAEDVHHFDASGKDKMWSQMAFQRKAEQHVQHHLDEVAAKAAELYERQPFNRLLVGGTAKAAAELRSRLGPPLKQRAMEAPNLGLDAPDTRVVAECAKRCHEARLHEQRKCVEELLTAAAKNGKAVTGVLSVVDACLQGRVSALLYTGSPRHEDPQTQEGVKCIRTAFETAGDAPPDAGPRDILDWLATHTIKHGGTAVPVMGEARKRLDAGAGGMGAFLR